MSAVDAALALGQSPIDSDQVIQLTWIVANDTILSLKTPQPVAGSTSPHDVTPPIYIGKESDKHWEEGEDLSLLEFKAIEYKRTGYAIATDKQLQGIAQVPKRALMRRGVNQHTLEKVCNKTLVRAAKLAQCLTILARVPGDS